MAIEKIITAPEPGFSDDRFDMMVRLWDQLGWDNYYSHYTAEEIDAGEYGDDIYDYTVMVPQEQEDLFKFMEEEGLVDFDIR